MSNRLIFNYKTKKQYEEQYEAPQSKEELNAIRITEIDEELTLIDKSTGLTRILEDIITHTGIYLLMYDDTKKIIERKKTLRSERAKLVKESEADASAEDNTNE